MQRLTLCKGMRVYMFAFLRLMLNSNTSNPSLCFLTGDTMSLLPNLSYQSSFVCHLCMLPSLYCHYISVESYQTSSATRSILNTHFSSFTNVDFVSLPVFVCARVLVRAQRDNERRAASAQHSRAQPPPGRDLPDLVSVPAGDAAVQAAEPRQGTDCEEEKHLTVTSAYFSSSHAQHRAAPHIC